MSCVHNKTWCRPCERTKELTSSQTGVRLPYARNPNTLKVTDRQLVYLSQLSAQLNRDMPNVETKTEASDAITLYKQLLHK